MRESTQNERINEFLSNGATLFNMGMYSELAEICREFEHEANDARVYSMLSGAEFALGDFNSAENSARLGLVLNPDSLDNMYNLAWIMNQKGEHAKALHYFICAKQLTEDDEVSTACAEEITKLEKLTGITAAEASDSAIPPLNPCISTEIVVLTDVYPSEETIYANMFIHARIKQYQKRGLNLRVFSFTKDKVRRVREYDGVEVIEGDLRVLQKFLENTVAKLLLVHFLYVQMWNIIKPHLNKLNALIFCHGWEIQPWYRRKFNYKPEELEAEKQKSSVRMQLWNDVFSTALGGAGIHFVFVSQSFANEVMEDHRIVLPGTMYSVIHNVIDTDLFKYTEKDPELRKHILLLGSFLSPKYGRDIAINAILKLSEHEEFSDMEFCVAGTGLLWDELTKPLEKLKNVKLMNGFFTHDEISVMQQYYGIAMLPTRWDSQGVTRDEAMSSGLVPVTNAISAIPEFVDDECGMLCPPDDVNAFAEAILKLYHNPELFMKLSKNAASRVRRQSSPEIVIEKELELFNEMIDKPPRVGTAEGGARRA